MTADRRGLCCECLRKMLAGILRNGSKPFVLGGDDVFRLKMPPHAVEKKLNPAEIERFQRRIAGFAQERQGNTEKLAVIGLDTPPEAGIAVQVLGEFRERDGQFVEFVFIQEKGIRFDVIKTIIEPVSKSQGSQEKRLVSRGGAPGGRKDST